MREVPLQREVFLLRDHSGGCIVHAEHNGERS